MTTTPKPEPASDAEIAGIEPNIAKTDWQTCSNCDAGLRSINTPPYLIGTHEDYCILTMWPKVKARIEADRARIRDLETELATAREQNRAKDNAFVEMNAVFEAVMRAIRGESLSEFDESHGSVYEAKILYEANRAKDEQIERLKNRMVFHYITLGDDDQPEGKQGKQRQREFFDECNSIIAERALAEQPKPEPGR